MMHGQKNIKSTAWTGKCRSKYQYTILDKNGDKIHHEFDVNNVMIHMLFLRIIILCPKGQFFGNVL
jgi:hypothetical protein